MPSSSNLPGVTSRRETTFLSSTTSTYRLSWSLRMAVSGTTTAEYGSLTGTRTRTRDPDTNNPCLFSTTPRN